MMWAIKNIGLIALALAIVSTGVFLEQKLDAMDKKDTKAMADSFYDAFCISDESPHEEGPHDDDEGSEDDGSGDEDDGSDGE